MAILGQTRRKTKRELLLEEPAPEFIPMPGAKDPMRAPGPSMPAGFVGDEAAWQKELMPLRRRKLKKGREKATRYHRAMTKSMVRRKRMTPEEGARGLAERLGTEYMGELERAAPDIARVRRTEAIVEREAELESLRRATEQEQVLAERVQAQELATAEEARTVEDAAMRQQAFETEQVGILAEGERETQRFAREEELAPQALRMAQETLSPVDEGRIATLQNEIATKEVEKAVERDRGNMTGAKFIQQEIDSKNAEIQSVYNKYGQAPGMAAPDMGMQAPGMIQPTEGMAAPAPTAGMVQPAGDMAAPALTGGERLAQAGFEQGQAQQAMAISGLDEFLAGESLEISDWMKPNDETIVVLQTLRDMLAQALSLAPTPQAKQMIRSQVLPHVSNIDKFEHQYRRRIFSPVTTWLSPNWGDAADLVAEIKQMLVGEAAPAMTQPPQIGAPSALQTSGPQMGAPMPRMGV